MRLDRNAILGVAALMAVVFLAGLRPIRIPGTITSITPGSGALLSVLFSFALLHFVLNSMLTAELYALKHGARLISLWWTNYSWTSLTSLASASAAGLIYLSIIQYGATMLLAAAPLRLAS